jgi:peptidoglycan/LPS O-acetylase OafA/YrhL
LALVWPEVGLVDFSVASSFRIRWPNPSVGQPGNPFQLEVGFANLALGILGIIAMGRRAVAVFGIGATIVHARDIIETGNLAPGNTIQNISNLLKPALLIGFLVAIRRAERSPDSEAHTSAFNTWRGPRIQAAGLITGGVAAGFSVGFAVDRLVIGTLFGTLVGAGFATFVITRARPRRQSGT